MPETDPDEATRRHKLWLTVSLPAWAWGVVWSVMFIIAAAEGGGPQGGSWIGAVLLSWGPVAVLEGARVWWRWFNARE